MSSQKYANLAEVVSAIKAETERIRKEKPQEVAAIYSGGLENQAGTNGQFFTTFDFANGLTRDGSMQWKNFVILAEDNDLSLKQLCKTIDLFDQTYSNYLRFSGFPTLGEFATALREHLHNEKDRKKVIPAVRICCAYVNQLAAWMFHEYPWYLSKQFKYANLAEIAAAEPPDLSRRVHIRDGRMITLTWTVDSLDGTAILGEVKAYLAVNENPELCQEFIDYLEKKGSFKALYESAVVSGQSTYAWCPLVSTADVKVKERQCDAPIGRIRYSQGTGDKIIIQYGAVTEDIETPVLGEIPPAHHSVLKLVGETALLNTFAGPGDKKEIWLTVALA